MNTSNGTAVKMGLFALTGLVVSSMMGSGVFSLPQNLADVASAGSVMLAWLVTGAGIYCIAKTFSILSLLKPNMTGIYAYAQDGFGDKIGFIVAWGYWLCNIFANTAFAVILMEALNYFFPPYFKGGNNLNSFICSSAIIWGIYLLIIRGIKTASLINFIGTCCKLVPLFFFIVVAFIVFKLDIFKAALTSNLTLDFAAVLAQVKNSMLITLWAFIGIEAGVVLSGKADQRDVTKATLIGFLIAITSYVLISVLPFGIMGREELSKLANPSTAGVLENIIGPFGGVFMNIGLIVSVLFAWLSWVIIAAEAPFLAAKGKTFPKRFLQERKGTPVFSVFVTTAATQFALLIAFCSVNAWDTMLSITAVMSLPVYLITSLYLVKCALKKTGFIANFTVSRGSAFTFSVLGTLYSLWIIYAANIKYLFMAIIFFLLGIPVYIKARRENR